MSLETATADHICNVVRREIQQEFPALTLLYIVHADGQRTKALEARRGELLEHPAGAVFLPHLQRMAQNGGPEFSGISIKIEKKFLILSKEKILACFFVNADRLENADEARRHALFLAWQSLSLIEDYKNDKKEDCQELDGIIVPKSDRMLRTWKYMLADAFSVLILEMDKKRDSIGNLGRQRSATALAAKAGLKPEHYAFPLVFDATRLLYHDMGKTQDPKENVSRALQLTREIGETFDRTTVRQWWAFSRTAQEMAWLGVEDKNILGAAVYSSEDPYVRATAYLVAEALNIQTLLPSPVGTYNPFAEPETSERYHMKACEEAFRTTISRANQNNSSLPFVDEAQKQNRRLMGGNPIGWCAYPLMCAEVASRTSPTEAKIVFDKALAEVPWSKVQDIVRMIILLRREGEDINPVLLSEKLQEVDDLKFLAPCFTARTA
ncbi:MAG: hypothetical protein WBK55_01000 [Alphaproteobacteria bacterium]